MSTTNYLLGMFAGGVLFATLVGVAAVMGSLVGSLMPGLDQARSRRRARR
ncbi:MAG: hypothetical protein QF921_14085 [Pseudomonadales bacterium]|nr:hypothetical protein [Pseudomonadales bacterium]MDP6827033.1 hypothetical protein [Pseudomonadales bacterium]MDP6972610.1 hypothetical protein [Pseudomonadales bacterium]